MKVYSKKRKHGALHVQRASLKATGLPGSFRVFCCGGNSVSGHSSLGSTSDILRLRNTTMVNAARGVSISGAIPHYFAPSMAHQRTIIINV